MATSIPFNKATLCTFLLIGQKVDSQAKNNFNDFTIDLTDFKNGVYLLELKKNSESRTYKFLKN